MLNKKLLLFFIMLILLCTFPVNAKELDSTFEKPITFNDGAHLNNFAIIDKDLVNRLKPISFNNVKPEIDIVNSEAIFHNISNKKYSNGAYSISSTNGNYYNLWYTNFYRNLFKFRNQSYDVKVSVLRVFDEASGMFFINPNKMSFSTDDLLFENSNPSNRYHGFELLVNIFKSNTTTGAVIPGLFIGIDNLNNIDGTNEGVNISYLEPDKKIVIGRSNNNYMHKDDCFYTLSNGDNFDNTIYITSYNIQNRGDFDITYATNRGTDDISFNLFLKSFNIKYNLEINNNITDINDEEVFENDYPKGVNIENIDGVFLNWTCDKDVTIDDRTILSGNPITNDELKQITVKDDLVFTAHFKAKKYKIRTSVQNGDIDLSTEVNQNETKSISYTPKTGYHLDTITVDGEKVNTENFEGFYTFENVTSDHEINVVFSINKYKIKTSVEGGVIDNEKEVNYGDNATISYHPYDGYKLYKVLVDDTLINSPREYDFINIKENHKIHVIYEKIPNIDAIKTSDKTSYKTGDVVSYNINLTQTVDGAIARDIIVTDTLNDNLILDENSLNQNSNIEVLEVSSTHFKAKIKEIKNSLAIAYKAKIKENVSKDEIDNDVTIKIGNLDDYVSGNNKIYIPKGNISSRVENVNYFYDDIVNYEIKVKQLTKGATINNALIKQSLPSELELIKASSDEIDIKINNNSLTGLVKKLANSEVTIKIKARVKTRIGKIRIVSSLLGDEIAYPIEDYFFINIKSPKLYMSSNISNRKAKVGDTINFYVDISSKNAKKVVLHTFIPMGLKLNNNSIKTDGILKTNSNGFTVSYSSLNTKKRIMYKAKVISPGTLKTIYNLDSFNNTSDSVSLYSILRIKKSLSNSKSNAIKNKNTNGFSTNIPMTGSNANNKDLYLIAIVNLVLVIIIVIIIKSKNIKK